MFIIIHVSVAEIYDSNSRLGGRNSRSSGQMLNYDENPQKTRNDCSYHSISVVRYPIGCRLSVEKHRQRIVGHLEYHACPHRIELTKLRCHSSNAPRTSLLAMRAGMVPTVLLGASEAPQAQAGWIGWTCLLYIGGCQVQYLERAVCLL